MQYSELHKHLEVGVGIHSLHKIGQHFITEDIVPLSKRNSVFSVRDGVTLNVTLMDQLTILGMSPGL